MPSYADMMKAGAVQKVDFIITSPKQSKHGTGGWVKRMRTIDADALKNRIQKLATEAWKMKIKASAETILNQFIDFINDAPTVSAQPEPKEGEWVQIQRYARDAQPDLECPFCKHRIGVVGYGKILCRMRREVERRRGISELIDRQAALLAALKERRQK